MRLSFCLLALLLTVLSAPATLPAQRHGNGAAPPTAPHPITQHAGAAPTEIIPVSTGLGALEFASVSFSVPAPQALTRQLQDTDDRTRSAALAAIGAPGEYLTHGHIPRPRAVQLTFAELGANEDLDAILTVQLDQHLVSAILLPEDGNWRRIATLIDPVPFADPSVTPSTFLQLARSMMEPGHFSAIFHAPVNGQHGDFIENEAHLRILNDHATIILSFASSARTCDPVQRTGCELTRRWVQADAADPAHRFVMVSGTGHLGPKDAADPLARSVLYQAAHLRAFTCQPFLYSEASDHFEPTARAIPCAVPGAAPPAHSGVPSPPPATPALQPHPVH